MGTLFDIYQEELDRYPFKEEMLTLHNRTREQIRIRLMNNAIRRAVSLWMKKCGLGYDYIKEDIVQDQGRSDHYGVPVGTSLGLKGLPARNHSTVMANLIKALRWQINFNKRNVDTPKGLL